MIGKNYLQFFFNALRTLFMQKFDHRKETLSILPLMPDPSSAFGHSPSLSLDKAIVEYSPLPLSPCQG